MTMTKTCWTKYNTIAGVTSSSALLILTLLRLLPLLVIIADFTILSILLPGISAMWRFIRIRNTCSDSIAIVIKYEDSE